MNSTLFKKKIAAVIISLFCFESIALANKDFPNYFLEKDLIQHTHQADRFTSHTLYVEGLVEEALFTILKQLSVPYVDRTEEDGTPHLTTHGFFEKIEQKIQAKDPGARVYVAGGVVRSLLGYIYKKLYNAHQKVPPETTEQVLHRIIRGEKRKGGSKNEILSLSALGVGSDLDILIDLSPTGKEHEQEIKKEVTDFINSAENAAHLRNVTTKFKYAVVPIGDVKDYHDQINRAVNQGGSTLDLLAFPITQASGAHIRTPEKYPDIFKKFLKGEYDYLPTKNPTSLKDPDKQTIRGLRPLLEIPYLHLSADGQLQMKKELEDLLSKVQKKEALSNGAYEQFGKMIRNARFEGAHNRFYFSDPKLLNSDEHVIESLVFQISEASQKNEKNLPLIPEFLVNRDPRKRQHSAQKDRCELQGAGLLMDQQTFIDQHTDQGILYHGTSQFDAMLSITRNGLIVSTSRAPGQGQGSAAFGRGTYMTHLRSEAKWYGTPLEFRLKPNINPRILKWDDESTQNHPRMNEIKLQATEKGQDLFQYLAEQCDVDIIVNMNVLLQNSAVIQLPKNMTDIIRLYSFKVRAPDNLDDPQLDAESIKVIFSNIVDYDSFHSLGVLLGIKDLPPVPDPTLILNALLAHPNPVIGIAAVNYLSTIFYTSNGSQYQSYSDRIKEVLIPFIMSLKTKLSHGVAYPYFQLHQNFIPTDPNALDPILSALENSQSTEWILIALKVLNLSQRTDPRIMNLVIDQCHHPDPLVRVAAAEFFDTHPTTDPTIQDVLVELFEGSDSNVSGRVINIILRSPPTDPKLRARIIHVLHSKMQDPSTQSRIYAINCLNRFERKDPVARQIIVDLFDDADAGVRRAALDNMTLGELVSLLKNFKYNCDPAFKDLILNQISNEFNRLVYGENLHHESLQEIINTLSNLLINEDVDIKTRGTQLLDSASYILSKSYHDEVRANPSHDESEADTE